MQWMEVRDKIVACPFILDMKTVTRNFACAILDLASLRNTANVSLTRFLRPRQMAWAWAWQYHRRSYKRMEVVSLQMTIPRVEPHSVSRYAAPKTRGRI